MSPERQATEYGPCSQLPAEAGQTPVDASKVAQAKKLEDNGEPEEAENSAEETQQIPEETQQSTQAQKTKKRRRKKKAAQSSSTTMVGAELGADACTSELVKSTVVRAAGSTDEEFAVWCQHALQNVPNGVDGMALDEKLKMDDAFAGYKFTGPLRPAHVTPQMKPPQDCSCIPDYATHPEGECESESRAGRAIPVLEGEELETMREACRLGREVLDVASRFVKVGVTGDEVDRVVWQACAERKLYPSPLNYFGFPKSVCVSPNEVICHGIPDCRPLIEGDIVNLDVSICHRGFHADLNETFFIGKCDEESHVLVRTAYAALRAASQMIRPGTLYRDLGAAIHSEAVQGGCVVAPAYCGHGVGRLFHGPPDVPHYKKNKAVGIMKPGHVFTVEPMLNLGNSGVDRTWPDGWTAVTRDGRRSAQFEHTFLVVEDGVEVLTARRGVDRTSMPVFEAAAFQR